MCQCFVTRTLGKTNQFVCPCSRVIFSKFEIVSHAAVGLLCWQLRNCSCNCIVRHGEIKSIGHTGHEHPSWHILAPSRHRFRMGLTWHGKNWETMISAAQVREASWEAFATLRNGARSDPFFVGCETQILREYQKWHPSTLASICVNFSRLRPAGHKATEQLLRRLLWRADRLILHLRGQELLALLEVFALRDLREHDPRRPDLFIEAVQRLQEEVGHLGLSEVRRIAALYKQLNLRNEELFQSLGTRLEELLQASAKTTEQVAIRPRKLRSSGTAEAAVMAFLGACGRLNIVPLQAQNLLETVGPSARAKNDLPRLAALAQLAAKFGCAETGEANRILLFVSTAFERAVPDNPTRKGYASQAVYGQLLLALIFDESTCEVRDRTLVASVQAVHSAFGEALGSLDERLARQLQVVELACRVERPGALQTLETKGLTRFLEGVKNLQESDALPLPKCSSQQHLQVSGALQELGVNHRMEEKLQPYIADVRVTRRQGLIEIDGPLHFVGGSKRYDMKTSLKHRLLTKQGWDVHHIAWNDWPEHHHSRLNYVARLLRSSAPGKHLMEYNPLESAPPESKEFNESRFQEIRQLDAP